MTLPTGGKAPVRYETLDALRGVAALAIVIFHLHAFKLLPDIIPHAYLAVDFFFILSGFVIAHAYAGALVGGMRWREFARRRLIRLMPLATLGALIGFLVLLMKWRLAPGRNDTLLNIVLSGSLNLFMLPSFFVGKVYGHEMFPGDNPLWSLFFELVANLAWGWLAVRLTVRQLAAFVAVSAASLVTMAVVHGSTQMGVTPATFGGGLARATFGFTLGVLLWRVRDHLRFPAAAWQALACAGILLFTFIGPLVFVHGKSRALAWDLACIFLVFPPLVGLGAARRPAGRLGVVLGELSYPVYVLHWPCLALAAGFAQRLGLNSLVLSAVLVPAIVFAAWLTHKLYDVPVRRWLGRRPGIAVARPA